MTKHSWTLTDVDEGVYLEEFSLTPADLPGAPEGWWVKKCTLRGGLQNGVDLVEIYNGRFGICVLPTRGMGLWRCFSGARTLGWKSPVRGPVHPKFVPLADPSGLGWLEGFDELLVRCGLVSNGAPEFDAAGQLRYGLHGRIANLPAQRVEVSFDSETGELAVTGEVEESRFHFHKLRLSATYTLKLGEPAVTIHDEVENFSALPGEMQLLYHINLGEPVHGPGSQLVLAIKQCAPRDADAIGGLQHWNVYGPAQPGQPEEAYFFELQADAQGRTQALLKGPTGDEGVSLAFSTDQLPCFVQWKNGAASADGYVTGLEPATNFPNPHSFEAQQGRVVPLAPGEKRDFDLRLNWLTSAAEIAAAEQSIAALQPGEPKIHTAPQSGWSRSE